VKKQVVKASKKMKAPVIATPKQHGSMLLIVLIRLFNLRNVEK